jgi:hypothetical protein
MWKVRVITVVMEAKKYVVCIVELHASVNNTKTILHKDTFMANLYRR